MGTPHWTDKEVRKLRKLFRDGKTDEEIGEALDRTTSGVCYKRNDIGLNRRKVSKPRKAKAKAAPAHTYTVIVRGPNRELTMGVDRDTGKAVIELMLGVDV